MLSRGENAYCTLLRGIGATRPFCFSFVDSNARAGRILSFKMLLDRGLRTNPVYNFANTRTPLRGPPGLGQTMMMRSINKNFKATAGETSVDSAIPKKGGPLSPKIGGDTLLQKKDPKWCSQECETTRKAVKC